MIFLRQRCRRINNRAACRNQQFISLHRCKKYTNCPQFPRRRLTRAWIKCRMQTVDWIRMLHRSIRCGTGQWPTFLSSLTSRQPVHFSHRRPIDQAQSLIFKRIWLCNPFHLILRLWVIIRRCHHRCRSLRFNRECSNQKSCGESGSKSLCSCRRHHSRLKSNERPPATASFTKRSRQKLTFKLIATNQMRLVGVV